MGSINRPVKFQGTDEEKQANRRTHHFSPTDWDEDGPQDYRCMDCECKPGHKAADYPCGTNPPRETITYKD